MEAKTLETPYANLSASEFKGARSHLLEAANQLNGGNFAASVRESIHSVEAMARVIDLKSNNLGDILNRLEKSGKINPNLKRGFSALYEYISDEKGVRHYLVFREEAQVSEAEAMYMIGACASFVSYLITKVEHNASPLFNDCFSLCRHLSASVDSVLRPICREHVHTLS